MRSDSEKKTDVSVTESISFHRNHIYVYICTLHNLKYFSYIRGDLINGWNYLFSSFTVVP